MSIWCSWREIGYESLGSRDWSRDHGEVRSYAEGFSNHYPTRDGEYEQPASVSIASIPSWCVPGHSEEETGCLGEWLRLDIDTAEHDFALAGKPTGNRIHAAIVMDDEAARALAADLLAWADRPKALPLGECRDAS